MNEEFSNEWEEIGDLRFLELEEVRDWSGKNKVQIPYFGDNWNTKAESSQQSLCENASSLKHYEMYRVLFKKK